MECRIVSLDDQTWRIEEFDAKDSVYLYLLAGDRSALLLDTGFGQIDVPAAVTALTCLPLTVVHSHGHFDHIGGDRSFEAVYLHPADRPLYDLHRARLPQPGSARVLDLTDGQLFDLGGRTLEVLHVPGHSPGSVCLLDRERRWLFTGDTCCKADVLLCLEYSGTVTEYAASIAKLQARRDVFDCTWPSHHAVPVEPSILDQFARAAQQVLDGAPLQPYETPFGTFRRLAQDDIGIVCTEETAR